MHIPNYAYLPQNQYVIFGITYSVDELKLYYKEHVPFFIFENNTFLKINFLYIYIYTPMK